VKRRTTIVVALAVAGALAAGPAFAAGPGTTVEAPRSDTNGCVIIYPITLTVCIPRF
jgi:hypothetical protein